MNAPTQRTDEIKEIRSCGIRILELSEKSSSMGQLKHVCTSGDDPMSEANFYRSFHFIEERGLVSRLNDSYKITTLGRDALKAALEDEKYDFNQSATVPQAAIVNATKGPSIKMGEPAFSAKSRTESIPQISDAEAEQMAREEAELHAQVETGISRRISALSESSAIQLALLYQLAKNPEGKMSLRDFAQVFKAPVTIKDRSGTLTITPKNIDQLHDAIDDMAYTVKGDQQIEGYVAFTEANNDIVYSITQRGIDVLIERQRLSLPKATRSTKATGGGTHSSDAEEKSILRESPSGIIVVHEEDITPKQWNAFLNKDGIKGLGIRRSPIKDEMFIAMIESLQSLRELHIEDCANISGTALKKIQKLNSNLRIRIENCPQLSAADEINRQTDEMLEKRNKKLEPYKTATELEKAKSAAQQLLRKSHQHPTLAERIGSISKNRGSSPKNER